MNLANLPNLVLEKRNARTFVGSNIGTHLSKRSTLGNLGLDSFITQARAA